MDESEMMYFFITELNYLIRFIIRRSNHPLSQDWPHLIDKFSRRGVIYRICPIYKYISG